MAVEVLSNEIRLFARKGDSATATTIQSMSPSFYTAADSSYWIKLEVNDTTAVLGVYGDASFTIQLGTTTFTIPALSSMNHLYLANCNGNFITNQKGYLDDYRIDNCSLAGMNNIPQSIKKKELVKVIDMLGRETVIHSNEPLILIYKDGSREKWMRVEAE